MVFALGDLSNFLIVPTAEVLEDKAFQVRGTIGYHQSKFEDRHPFVASVNFGLFNSLEFGIQTSSTVSLSVKNRINEAFGIVPAVAIGARAFVESPEAYFYSVDKKARREQTGEFYAVAQWGNDWWNLLGGVSAFPGMTADEVAPFWGFEQKINPLKLSLVYEGFFRYGDAHHNIGLAFKPANSLQISAGATNFYRYFFDNDGDFGFDVVRDGASSGYRAPGVYMSIAVSGGFASRIQNQKIEIDSLKRQLSVQSRDLNELRLRLDDLETAVAAGSGSVSTNLYGGDIQKEYKSIVDAYNNDNTNLDSLLTKEQIFMEKGMISKRFLIREAKDINAEQQSRIVAIRMMSHFPDNVFLEPLGSLVADNSNETIAREAAFALGTINTPEARKILATVANETTGIVRETIIEILGAL